MSLQSLILSLSVPSLGPTPTTILSSCRCLLTLALVLVRSLVLNRVCRGVPVPVVRSTTRFIVCRCRGMGLSSSILVFMSDDREEETPLLLLLLLLPAPPLLLLSPLLLLRLVPLLLPPLLLLPIALTDTTPPPSVSSPSTNSNVLSTKERNLGRCT